MKLIVYILVICLFIYCADCWCSNSYTVYKNTFSELRKKLKSTNNSKNIVQITCTNKDLVIICEHKDLAIFKYKELRDNCVKLLDIIINNDCKGVSCPNTCSTQLTSNGIMIDTNQVVNKKAKNNCNYVAS
jgi:hypothetical protein